MPIRPAGPTPTQPNVGPEPHAVTVREEQARSRDLGGQYTWRPLQLKAPTASNTQAANHAHNGDTRWVSAVIDNYTSQWLRISEAGPRFIPPMAVGVVVPLADVAQITADWIAPTGITQPALAGATAYGGIILLTDHELEPDAGTIVGVAYSQLGTLTVTAPTDATTAITLYDLDATQSTSTLQFISPFLGAGNVPTIYASMGRYFLPATPLAAQNGIFVLSQHPNTLTPGVDSYTAHFRAGSTYSGSDAGQWVLRAHFISASANNTSYKVNGTYVGSVTGGGGSFSTETACTAATVVGVAAADWALGNFGSQHSAQGATTGANCGLISRAALSTEANIGNIGGSLYATNSSGSEVVNIGAILSAVNASSINIGAYISNNGGNPSNLTSSVLLIDGAGAGNPSIVMQSGSTRLTQFSSTGSVTRYRQVATAGWGIPSVYGEARSTGQTGAKASVAAYTVGSAEGSFIIGANVNVTAYVSGTFTVTCTYTDENSNPRTLVLNFTNIAGTIATAIASAGAFEGLTCQIRCKASTSITIGTTGTFTSLTYSAEGSIIQIA